MTAWLAGCGKATLERPDSGQPPGTVDAGPTPDAASTIDAGPTVDANPTGCIDIELGSELGQVYSGTTVGAGNERRECEGESAPDVVFAWVAPQKGRFTFDTCGSAFDTVLSARIDTCDGVPVACSDDIDRCELASGFDLELEAGQRVLLIVDGLDSERGAYLLNITAEQPAPM